VLLDLNCFEAITLASFKTDAIGAAMTTPYLAKCFKNA
jgi:hypothetical protein